MSLRTPHEGIYQAWEDSLQWIDPETDLPCHLSRAFSDWRLDTFDVQEGEASPGRVLLRIRSHDIDDMLTKIHDLRAFLEAIQRARRDTSNIINGTARP